MSFPGGNPFPSHNTSIGAMSFLGGTPVTGPRSLPGEVTHCWLGVPQDVVLPGHFPRNRTAKGVLDMRWAVYLLRSRRRTFLFQVLTQANQRSLASKCFAEWGFLFSNGSRDWGCKKTWNSNTTFSIRERLFPCLWIQ